MLPHSAGALVPPQVAVPAGTPGPDVGFQLDADRQFPLGPTFRMNAYGRYDSTDVAGHSLFALPIAGENESNPCMSCAAYGRGALAVVLRWQ